MRQVSFALVLLSFAVAACGPSPRPETDDEACAEFFGPEAIPASCDGICMDLATNQENCGFCGYACGLGTNACVDGQCVCANGDRTVVSKDACDFPAVCDETGWCLTPDPLGERCDEIDGLWCEESEPQRVCVAGFCTVPDCDGPEVCNLLDDDCDGLADQSMPGDPLSQPCYSGDPATAGVGICREGEQLCVAGGWTNCLGEQLPTSEDGLLNCDGLDGDCNGCIDDHLDMDGTLVCGMADPKTTDVIFMIDVSGSMSGVLSAVITATGDFAGLYASAPHIRWGIERIAEVPPTYVDVQTPLTGFMAFLGGLAALMINGGTEPTYDAVYVTATGGYDGPLLNGAMPGEIQIYVVFGDENAQTLMGLTEAQVCQAVAARGAILVVFATPAYFTEWDDCAILYPLTSNAAQMTMQLDELFDLTCTF